MSRPCVVQTRPLLEQWLGQRHRFAATFARCDVFRHREEGLKVRVLLLNVRDWETASQVSDHIWIYGRVSIHGIRSLLPMSGEHIMFSARANTYKRRVWNAETMSYTTVAHEYGLKRLREVMRFNSTWPDAVTPPEILPLPVKTLLPELRRDLSPADENALAYTRSLYNR